MKQEDDPTIGRLYNYDYVAFLLYYTEVRSPVEGPKLNSIGSHYLTPEEIV
jgi:hypothetical protein